MGTKQTFLSGKWENEKETSRDIKVPTTEENIYRSIKQPEAREGDSVQMSLPQRPIVSTDLPQEIERYKNCKNN